MQPQSKIESACEREHQTQGHAAQCHRGRKQEALVDANTKVTATLFMPPQYETLKATVCAKTKVISTLFKSKSNEVVLPPRGIILRREHNTSRHWTTLRPSALQLDCFSFRLLHVFVSLPWSSLGPPLVRP